MDYKIKDCRCYDDLFWKKKYALLNDEQKEKIDHLKNVNDKKVSLLGLVLVSDMLSIPIKDIYYVNHKPMTFKAHISITHKYPYVGVATSNKRVGIDIETMRNIDSATLKYLGVTDTMDAFILWTRKESLFKSSLKTNYQFKTWIVNREFIVSFCEEVD